MTAKEFFDGLSDFTDAAQSTVLLGFAAATGYEIVRGLMRSSGGGSGSSSGPPMEGQTDEFAKIESGQREKERRLRAYSEWVSLRKSLNDELQTYDQVTLKLATTQGMEDVSFDAHFWSHDKLRAAARTILEVELSPDTPEDEILWHVDEARGVLRRMDEICQQAGASFVDSQQRLQLCLGVREAFLRRGWRQRLDEDCDFEVQDERNTLNLCIYSPANDEMRLAFHPDHTISLRMNVNRVHNRDLRREIARTLLSALEQWGVTVNNIDYAN